MKGAEVCHGHAEATSIESEIIECQAIWNEEAPTQSQSLQALRRDRREDERCALRGQDGHDAHRQFPVEERPLLKGGWTYTGR
jgi:hypothetical protein